MSRATKTIRVDVTEDDIAKGVPFDEKSCPVAWAMTRAMRMPMAVKRGRWNGRWVGIGVMRGLGAEFRLSRSVGNFTLHFDMGEPVEPFTFRVVK